MKEQERRHRINELLNMFPNGRELYLRSPSFNMAIQQMARGMSVYDRFAQIIEQMDNLHNAFNDHVMEFGNKPKHK